MVDYKGYEITIEHDDDPQSPREWETIGHMACWHSRYRLGDENLVASPTEYLERLCESGTKTVQKLYQRLVRRFDNNEVTGDGYLAELINIADKECVFLPLYLYDHSGLSMSTTRGYPFNCPWDSSQVGWIAATRDRLKKIGIDKLTKKSRAKIYGILRNEVSVYNMYLQGDVWGYVVKKDGELVDSCWGYYGTDDALESGKEYVDSLE